jgi:hypothetical protein
VKNAPGYVGRRAQAVDMEQSSISCRAEAGLSRPFRQSAPGPRHQDGKRTS